MHLILLHSVVSTLNSNEPPMTLKVLLLEEDELLPPPDVCGLLSERLSENAIAPPSSLIAVDDVDEMLILP